MRSRFPARHGSSLVLVLVLGGVAALSLGAILNWSRTTTGLTARNSEYFRAQAAAEAAVEKVIAHVGNDYQNYGIELVNANLGSYRSRLPSVVELGHWSDYEFVDEDGTAGQVSVDWLPLSSSTVLSSKYTGLRGLAYDLRIVANARVASGRHTISARNRQIIELAAVALFQYAVFYDEDLEINPGPPMTITGPVHCNTDIYMEPGDTLDFLNEVTSSGHMFMHKKPGDPLNRSPGPTTFASHRTEDMPSLNLPIGTVNDPANIGSILLDPPPVGEDPNSVSGRIRLYNQADMIIAVRDTGVTVTSGVNNNFATVVPASQASLFVKTTPTFYNGREEKTVKCTEIDVSKLKQWNATNTLLRPILPFQDVRTVYVIDLRTQTSSTQPGVRLVNGQWLTPKGLTVVSPNPLYVKGHYNVTLTGTPVNLGTHDTSATLPAAFIADAVTILSPDWNDANSTGGIGTRKAVDTTINAAIMAGNVPTVSGSYSGGLENFPRFLEDWNGDVFTYNGSMVCVFRSRTATAPWSSGSTYYKPPDRDWAFDENFNDLTKLPPATPQARLLIRGSWAD